MNARSTETPQWLLVLRPDGVIESVDGGAPVSWVTRNVAEIPELAGDTAEAFAALQQRAPTLVRRSVVSLMHEGQTVALELLMVEALPLRRAHTRITELIMRSLDAFMAQAKSSDVDLSIEQASGIPPVIFIDGEKISWALATLVGNALRYIRMGTQKKDAHVRVQLSWNEPEHELVIAVKDNGPGMPEHRSRWLFECDPADGQPAGLALLMVRDVLVAHRGTIEVKSTIGEGTTFTLRIPKPRVSSS